MEFRKIIRSKKWAIEMRSNWYGFLKYQMSPIFGTHWWSRGISIIRLLPFRDVLPSPGNIISHNLKVFFFFWVSFNVLAKTFRFTELSKLKNTFLRVSKPWKHIKSHRKGCLFDGKFAFRYSSETTRLASISR